VRTEAAGQFPNALDSLVAAFTDDVGGAELLPERYALGVVAEQDDLLGLEALGGDHTAGPTAPSPTTATDLPGPTFAATAAWWPVPMTSVRVSSDGISASSSRTGNTTSVPSACGTRTLTLAAVDVAPAVATAMQALALQPLAAEHARSVRPEERRQHQIPGLHCAHLGADSIDDADELMSHTATGVVAGHRLVRPKIATADGGARHPHERVGRLDQVGVGNALDADVAGAVHQRRAHSWTSFERRHLMVFSPIAETSSVFPRDVPRRPRARGAISTGVTLRSARSE
jgi:hypothetical protein